ncbi:SDR family NAD(P)-dependent oxidoreductase [Chitinophaga filiformis]|uniref:SDR family NAD(P)-dependent oxidoreductase n=1 Tax=Chitinophaga filiformis TaxID=104663 RepID=UPI001F367FC1|nr:SDR family NAD(P)-dependent oxidoreductase [Chitinophaga filiformis]MCF6404608.1 SDR family NAD(P)-dependent oxidoreductase [Chitinophaga filiformis]
MARVFITGSADGLGLLSAKTLIDAGHQVVLHARNEERKSETIKKLPGAESILTGDLSDIEQTKKLAQDVNELGMFDAVIHNAGVYNASARQILHVNILAPYILTCLIQKPKRLIYLSSGMHFQGNANFDLLNNSNRVTYSDSKLLLVMLSIAVSRKWTDVYSNALDPGWVPTKMGGRGAPDNLQKGYETQVWLATSNDEKAKVSGHYFFHQKEKRHNPEADNIVLQERLLEACRELTGVSFPD